MIRRVAVSWECTHSPSLSFSSPQTHSPIKLWVFVCVLTQYLLSPHLLLFCVHLGGGSSSSSSVVLNHWYQQVLNLNLKYKITYWFTQLDVLDLEDFIDNAFTRFLRCMVTSPARERDKADTLKSSSTKPWPSTVDAVLSVVIKSTNLRESDRNGKLVIYKRYSIQVR